MDGTEAGDGARYGDPAWLARVVDLTPTMTFAIDRSMRVVWSSGAVERLLGYRVDEVVGRNVLEFVHESTDPIALRSIDEALHADGLRLPIVFRLRRADGAVGAYEICANNQLGDPALDAIIVSLRRWDERSLLEDVFEAVASGDDLESVLSVLVQVCGAETLEAHGAVLLEPTRDGFGLVVTDAAMPDAVAAALRSHDGPETPWRQAAEQGHPQAVACSELPPPLAEAFVAAGLDLCWVQPVLGQDGAAAGCVVATRGPVGMPEERWPDPPRARVLASVARMAALAVEQARSRSQLEHAAASDALTGLRNRATFYDELERATDEGATSSGARLATSGGQVGVLYVDLDGFKQVNDQEGHLVGDEVLLLTARRLAGAVRAEDVVARLGGDEFAVLCDGIAECGELEVLAERVVVALSAPYEARGRTVRLGVSVGISLGTPGACTGDELVEAADRALYEVKADGAGGWALASD